MKTKLFSRFDLVGDSSQDFKKDLATLISLDRKKVQPIIEAIPKISASLTSVETNALIEKLSDATGLTIVTINDVVGILRFFIGCIINQELKADDFDSWVDDLLSAKVITCPD